MPLLHQIFWNRGGHSGLNELPKLCYRQTPLSIRVKSYVRTFWIGDVLVRAVQQLTKWRAGQNAVQKFLFQRTRAKRKLETNRRLPRSSLSTIIFWAIFASLLVHQSALSCRHACSLLQLWEQEKYCLIICVLYTNFERIYQPMRCQVI